MTFEELENFVIGINEKMDILIQLLKANQSSNEKLTYTAKELAEMFGMKNTTTKIDELRKDGLLGWIKPSKEFVYPREEVIKFLQTYKGYELNSKENRQIALVQQKKCSQSTKTRTLLTR